MSRLSLSLTALAAATLAVPTIAVADSVIRARTSTSSVTLRGFEGLRMNVRILRVFDPAEAGELDEPPAGKRLVGVEIRLRNVGAKTYSDSPGNGADLVTGGGKAIDATITTGGDCDTAGSLRVPRGQTRTTCLAFDVPDGARLKYFEFTLNSGFANQTGQWRPPPPSR
jgi:hypothetical protein